MHINKNTTVVDVRPPEDFEVHHFPGAINIPLYELAERMNEFKTFPKPIVAYCRSGNSSGVAVALLKQGGITEVINGGGLDNMFKTVNHV